MEILLHKILHDTKEKKLQRKLILKLASMLIITFIIISVQIFVQKDNAIAASGIRIYNYTTKKEYTYTDMQVKVTYNGRKISRDSTPGLLESNIALVSYKDIFAGPEINAICVYDKATGTVSISKSGTTIVLKIGSKTARINGKEVTAPVAPVKIKYVKENIAKVLVPSRFIFENLGYEYSWNKSTSTVSIVRKSEPMFLSYNDGNEFYYNGTQGKVTIDGENINLGNMPSIITNNTAMLRAKRVFADTKINAVYKYNAKDKSITLSRDGNVLEMKIGSPVAHLNGRAIVLDTAPMLVTNHDSGNTYVMVPGSFTASCLGYDYKWNKNTMTSILTSRKDEVISEVNPLPDQKPSEKNDASDITNDNKSDQNQNNIPGQTQDKAPGQTQDKAPELGDSAVKWDRGTIIHQWEGNKALTGVSTGVHSINNGSATDRNGTIYSVTRDYSNVKINMEKYAVVSDNLFTGVISEAIGRQIRLNISNMSAVNNTYYLGAINGGITDTIKIFSAENMSSTIEFNLLSEDFTYDLSLSPDGRILFVTIYQNFLEKATIGTNDEMDYITLTGYKPLDIVTNQLPGLITLEIPRTKKLIDDQYINIYEAKNIVYTNVFYTANSTFIYIGLNDNYDYYVVEEGNSYTIMLPEKDKPFTPIIPNIPDTSEEPAIPNLPNASVTPEYPIGDQSKYELIIPNPAGLSVNKIKHEDQYSRLRFRLCIPGDYTSYYAINPIKINSKMISDVSVFLNSNNETEILVTTSVLQGYEIFADANYIYVNIDSPRKIYKNIVVLDPGHGGPAPGANYSNTNEKVINFKILYEIGKDFFNTDPSQLKVYYTRESDVDLSLADRAAFAEKIGADLFVSLHMNANTNYSIYGTEIYYSNNNNKKNSAGLNSETLAKIFVNNLSYSLKTNNRGTRAAKYTVVHKNTVPAVLIELGFMSNKNDFALISDSAFQYKAAKAIYETLLQVFELYPTGR